MKTSLIVAADERDTIGRAGDLPWHLSADLRRFRQRTLGHVVVAGRRTHESIVARLGRPLPGRFTVVATRRPGLLCGAPSADALSAGASAAAGGSAAAGLPPAAGAVAVAFQPSVASALSVARGIEEFAGRDEVFVIGGADVYAQALDEVTRVYLTRVHQTVDGDAAMPPGWLDPFGLVDREDATEGEIHFSFLTYERG